MCFIIDYVDSGGFVRTTFEGPINCVDVETATIEASIVAHSNECLNFVSDYRYCECNVTVHEAHYLAIQTAKHHLTKQCRLAMVVDVNNKPEVHDMFRVTLQNRVSLPMNYFENLDSAIKWLKEDTSLSA